MIGIAVIGYGYWGPNLVRNIAESPNARVIKVVDAKPERLELARRRHPAVDMSNDAAEAIADPRVDAVAIATPVGSHFDLATRALNAGKHVLVEKPICVTSREVEQLVELADKRGLILMVDHTFPYTGAVHKVKQLIEAGELGDIYYYDSGAVNLGCFREERRVVDLAVHDLSIMDYVLRKYPHTVSCTGCSHIPNQPEDVAYMTLYFNDNLIAHLHVNWLSPVKLRRTLIGGSRKMIVYDDLEPAEKVRIHDKGLILDGDLERVHELRLRGYRSGDVWSPQVDLTEALRTEIIHFAHCIEGKEKPLTDGASGLRIVRLLEAASESMRQRGVPIEVKAL